MWTEALDEISKKGYLGTLLSEIKGCGPRLRDAAVAIEAFVPQRVRIGVTKGIRVLDREPLRALLGQLEDEEEGSTVRLVLVRGGQRSGKTWGRHLFLRQAREQGAEGVYLTPSMAATVDLVVQKLFAVVGASDAIPLQSSTPDAWYSVICFRLQEAAAQKNRPVWIAVDDLGPGRDGEPLIEKEVKQFWDQFALNLADPSFAKWFRLMLIHYPEGDVPTGWSREIWEEDRCCETDVTAADVEKALWQWLDSHQLREHEDRIKLLAANVIAAAEARAGPRLERINAELGKVLTDFGGAAQ